MPVPTLQEQFGQIDIYLFDQLLKGRITPGMRILDAGCGSGRNLVYFLRQGYEVYGADCGCCRPWKAFALSPASSRPLFRHRISGSKPVERMSFDDACADVVISSAVLHFADDDAQFESMLRGSWRVLKPGGLFFCRLASTIGMESQVQPVRGRRFQLPDGSERYLVDEDLLGSIAERLGGEAAEPLKTTVVQNQRSMTTWVLRKKRR